MVTGITRRAFLKTTGGALTLSLLQLDWLAGAERKAQGGVLPEWSAEYRNWEDVYRNQWAWDRIGKSTHFVNCWYQRGCAWNIYVRDGLVWREEQVAAYAPVTAEAPDFNPRGCQKGACYSQRMYDPARLRYPLKRVGKRGEGKWKRISWEQALQEIADATIDALRTDGAGAVVFDEGTAISNGCNGLGLYRTHMILDTPLMDMNSECGDHRPGVWATTGKMMFSGSMDDLFYSDLILVWGGNPVYTQIPNAHFINEARYKGARVVTIAPDYNASAIHADLWVPVNVGSDAALGLAMSHVIVEEGLYNKAFLVEQTDMPLLVRTDTQRFLRAADLRHGGGDDVFYVFDQVTQKIAEAPRRDLRLHGIEPALEGEFQVDTVRGKVTVMPVFARLRKQLAAYSPEASAKITGADPAVVRALARQIGKAKAAIVLAQANFSKFYHGLEMERAQLLVLTLAGHCGKKGTGITGFPYINLGGVDGMSAASGSLPPKLGLQALAEKMAPQTAQLKEQGYSTEMMIYQQSKAQYAGGGTPAAGIFMYFHGGLGKLYGRSKEWDPHLKRDLKDYLAEALQKGWQADPSALRPRVFFQVGGNIVRRIRGYNRMFDDDGLFAKIQTLVTADPRMSNTALHSDYVLPGAGWYEKDDITWSGGYAPYAHPTTKVVNPIGEAKSDWEFHTLLVKALQQRAIERGTRTYKDRSGNDRRLDNVYDEFTFGGRFTESNPDEMLAEILSLSDNLGGISWQELKQKGFARYTGVGTGLMGIGNATDVKPNETITANTWHTEQKLPWPTLTRRIQFYIDHDFFLELGEELPVHKDNPPIGGNYPLQLTGGHTRWSIHATWRDQKHMLQLQRGEPAMFMGPADAAVRGIRDGDRARVFNDLGSFEIQVKLSAQLRPGQVLVYHAWEPYQFKDGLSYASIEPAPINPVQLAGGYFHLQPMLAAGAPGSPDRGTRVEVKRIAPPA